MRPRRRLLFASLVALVAACGSRTGLLVPLDEDSGGADARPDNVIHRVDATEEDAIDEEALPPLDVRPPKDVILPSDCPDAGSTLIYLISNTNNLYSFYPPTAVFKQIGAIACPSASQPFSMAVDRKGIAYIVFQDGELFRVSTATAACIPTGFSPAQQGFPTTFGMGFSQDTVDAGETLYVASDSLGSAQLPQLGTIDVLHGYTLNIVGDFNPSITRAELTGTGAGGLFGFWQSAGSNDSAIVQIDKSTAQVTNSSTLPGVSQGNGWAFAFWGGDFYTFTAPSGSTVVTRFNPNDGSVVQVAQTNDEIVGAGVSTCAPQQ